MDSCGFESQSVHPVVGHYTVTVIASTKRMFVKLTVKMLCGSGATLLLIREQIQQLEFRKTKVETYVFVEFYLRAAVSDIKN